MPLHLVLEALVPELRLDLLLHLIEGLALALLALRDDDDVVAVLRLHDVAHLAGLESERGPLELRHHAALAEGPEVAALLRGGGVRRLLLRQLGELLGML